MTSIFVVSGSSPHQATGSFRQGQGRAPAGRRAEFTNPQASHGRARGIAWPSYWSFPMGQWPVFGENRVFASRRLCTVKNSILATLCILSTYRNTGTTGSTRHVTNMALCPRFSTPGMALHAHSHPTQQTGRVVRHQHYAYLCAYSASRLPGRANAQVDGNACQTRRKTMVRPSACLKPMVVAIHSQ